MSELNEAQTILFKEITAICVEQLGVREDEVNMESSFIDNLGADSLDTVELVMVLEDDYDVEIPDEEAEKLLTVKDAVEYLESRT